MVWERKNEWMGLYFQDNINQGKKKVLVNLGGVMVENIQANF